MAEVGKQAGRSCYELLTSWMEVGGREEGREKEKNIYIERTDFGFLLCLIGWRMIHICLVRLLSLKQPPPSPPPPLRSLCGGSLYFPLCPCLAEKEKIKKGEKKEKKTPAREDYSARPNHHASPCSTLRPDENYKV